MRPRRACSLFYFMENEEWRDVPGFENHYQVSESGIVRTKERYEWSSYRLKRNMRIRRARIRVPSRGSDGYAQHKLMKEAISKTIPVHRIVAITFIPNPKNLPQVNHIDG